MMLDLNEIFSKKQVFDRITPSGKKMYREHQFYHASSLGIKTGLTKPVFYIADRKAVVNASHFSMVNIPDTDYDIYVLSCDSAMLLYFIDIKGPLFKVVPNGIIVRRRPPQETDKVGVAVRYTLEHFLVISNKLSTCSIFTRNITSDPTT